MKITFKTETEEEEKVAEQFMDWLCGQGEQDYWQWMENCDGCPIIRQFDYDFGKLEIKCSRIEDNE